MLIITDLDLSSLISQADSTASEIVANQKDALVERKDVAQKTKDFRKLDDAGKLAEYKTLLKSTILVAMTIDLTNFFQRISLLLTC